MVWISYSCSNPILRTFTAYPYSPHKYTCNSRHPQHSWAIGKQLFYTCFCKIYVLTSTFYSLKVLPKRATDPPTVFYWFPFIGSAIQYGNDPLNFFLECQKKVQFPLIYIERAVFLYLFIQYGNVFTFILLGRRVTVALGVKGNNFILGGKSTVFNAEDAYKVHHYRMLDRGNFHLFMLLSLASHYTHFWQGRRLRCC